MGERAQQHLYQNTGDIFGEVPHCALSSSRGCEIVATALLKANPIHKSISCMNTDDNPEKSCFKYMYFDRGRLFYMWWTWPNLEQYLKYVGVFFSLLQFFKSGAEQPERRQVRK